MNHNWDLRQDSVYRFYRTDNIRSVEINADSGLRMLPQAPETLFTAIGRNEELLYDAARCSNYHAINLDTAAGLVRLFGPVYVSQCLSSMGDDHPGLLAANSYNFEVTNTKGMTKLHDWFRSRAFISKHLLEALEKKVCSIRSGDFKYLVRAIEMQVALRFEIDNLQDVRIDLVKLIDATLILRADCKVIIVAQNMDTSVSFTLFELRRSAMLVWPKAEPERDGLFPEIWMDGLGKILEIKAGMMSLQEGEYENINTREIRILANAFHGPNRLKIIRTTFGRLFPRQGSSYEMLQWLRDDSRGGSKPEAEHDEWQGVHKWKRKLAEVLGCEDPYVRRQYGEPY